MNPAKRNPTNGGKLTCLAKNPRAKVSEIQVTSLSEKANHSKSIMHYYSVIFANHYNVKNVKSKPMIKVSLQITHQVVILDYYCHQKGLTFV